jgi:cold shock CspA family protein
MQQAVIESVDQSGGSGLLIAQNGRRFVFEAGALSGLSLEELSPGLLVEFEPGDDGQGGPMAALVRAPEKAARGKLPPAPASPVDRGGSLDQEPPPAVREDEVAEASWESFPASDPPAHSDSG